MATTTLISVATLKSITDKFGSLRKLLKPYLGISTGGIVAGTARALVDNALSVLTLSGDYYQQADLSTDIYTVLQKTNIKDQLKAVQLQAVNAINSHISARGNLVASSIVDLPTFLSYYNGGSGDVAFSSMLSPEFGDLYYDFLTQRLPAAGLYAPGIHPWLNSTYTAGMGTRAVGGAYSDGAAVDTDLYSAVQPMVEVTVDFAGGATAPTVTIAGTDNTGATTTTWSVTLTGNNPAAAVSTTITPGVTAQSRQTVAFGSATGIVIGSVLKVNAGLIDEEVIIVENVSGSDITAVFEKAHSAGAAVTGYTTAATTPSVAGRRCTNVSGITIGIGTHTDGTVRISGRQDRACDPD